MNVIKTIVIFALVGLASCNHTPNTANKSEDKPQQITQQKQEIIKPEKYIDFFGVAMYGDFKSMLDSMEKKNVLKVDRNNDINVYQCDTLSHSFAVVDFCGAEWGFNVDYKCLDDNLLVTDIIMLTSSVSEELIDSTYKRLFDYYGEPYDHDIYENRDRWYMPNYNIVSRYLHVEEGGRTIYFDLNNF